MHGDGGIVQDVVGNYAGKNDSENTNEYCFENPKPLSFEKQVMDFDLMGTPT